jgi:meso-butanediol dehydrogenase / (S,S)-butanediol dehydrogenase / diacetyl reductase
VNGRGVLVVGSTSEIGLAIGRAFALTGARVAGAALEPLEDPSFVQSVVADCRDPGTAQQVVGSARCVLGRLDVVVLAAAVAPVASAASTTDEQWSAAVDTTLTGAFHILRAALPVLPRGGCVVAVSSVNAELAAPGMAAYAAAKAGLEGLIRQIALEYGPLGIRANAVAPAMIGHDDLPGVTDGYPLQRVGRPEDVASAVVFLADASFITGVTLPVDGGLSIASPAAFLRPDLRQRFL